MPRISELLAFDPKLFAELDQVIRATCRRYEQEPDDLDDAAEETWLIICKPAVSLRDPAKARLWASRIAQRVCLRRIARRRRERTMLATLMVSEQMVAEPTNERLDQVLADARKALLVNLPPNQFDILAEQVVFRRSLTQIAQRHGISVGAVKQRLHRARSSLREQYETVRRAYGDRDEPTLDGWPPPEFEGNDQESTH